MAKKEFSLGDSLAAALGSVSDYDHDEQIEYISLQYLVSDERNFYSMDGVEELAANIELIGLQQPLRVLKGESGFYVIVSGHRRAAALRLLAEETPEKWDRVPCIVERPGASPQLEELRLIMANADTRKMSSADVAKQAERVQQLLYELKEQGYEFPGRMRDHVAEACKISSTKLAMLKVIREKLLPEWKKKWERGDIPESTAYMLAKEDETIQKQVLQIQASQKGKPEWWYDHVIHDIKAIPEKTCSMCESGKCDHAWQMLFTQYREGAGNCCGSRECCEACYSFEQCTYSCPLLEAMKKKRKEDKRNARKVTLAKEKARDQELIDTATRCWDRFAALRAEAGLSVKDAIEKSGRYYCKGYHDDRFKGYETKEKKPTPGMDLPFAGIHADDVQAIIKTADMLGCSTDYLLGRTEDPAPAAPAQKTLQFRTTATPDHDCVCWCAFTFGDKTGCQGARWKDGKWWFYNIEADIDAECLGWIELPDYEGVLKK